MNLAETFGQGRTVFSVEVFPPKPNGSLASLYRTVESLADIKPDYISVTYGAGGNLADTKTQDICMEMKTRYGIEPLAHLTCVNNTRAEVEAVLRRFQDAGIQNILALRGDIVPDLPRQTDFAYAYQLIETVKQHGPFHVAAACYPEGHPESGGLKTDILHLKRKVDAGAGHLISQLFFDNADFYTFLYRAREAGISVPIEAGIMPVVNRRQIERMVTLCGASLPKRLTRLLQRYGHDDDAMLDAGIAYATEQIIDLIGNQVQGIHLYTMNRPYIARRINENIRQILRCVNRDAAADA